MYRSIRNTWLRIRHQRTLAFSIIVVLALSSSAVAVVMAVADAVILRPLPYRALDRLAVIWELGTEHQNVMEVSHRNYLDWRAQSKSFENIAAFGSVNWGQRLTGHGEPTEVPAAAVSASFFDVLGVPPHLGRVLREADDRPHAASVTVIGYGLWQRLFGGDTGAIGRQLTLDGEAFEIVGVMPAQFEFPRGAQLWIPVTPPIDAASAGIKTDALEARWFGVLFALGRLRSGSTVETARRELDAINADIDRRTGAREPRTVVLTSLEERLLGHSRVALRLLLAAVILIILIACANVVTLLLMRASRTSAEAAVRRSLGAGSTHIFGLWLKEALVLFVVAMVGGLALATVALPWVIRLAPDSIYRITDARLTLPIMVVIAAAMVVAAGLTAALVTVLSSWRFALPEALREGGRTGTSSRMRAVRRLFVTTEIAVACVLLVGAGLTIRSFVNLRTLDLGFVPDSVFTFAITPSRGVTATANQAFYKPLLERISRLPDVVDAGGVFLRPLAFEAIGTDTRILPEGHEVGDLAAWKEFSIPVNKETATPGYFGAMQIALREGRYFTESDDRAAPRVAMISENAAKRLFPGRSAVGTRIVAGEATLGPDGKPPWRTVVGVVSNVRYRGVQDLRFDYYLPYGQGPDQVQHVVVRTRGNPLQSIAQVKYEARQLDPLAVIDGVTTMGSVVDQAIAPWRLNMVLFAVLGTLALAIASVGVYGVVQYAVVERWHELGIRAALGASSLRLLALIGTEGAMLAVCGIAAGGVVAWSLSRMLTTILFEIAPTDEITFLAVGTVLIVVVALASFIPARHASRANPASLLRSC